MPSSCNQMTQMSFTGCARAIYSIYHMCYIYSHNYWRASYLAFHINQETTCSKHSILVDKVQWWIQDLIKGDSIIRSCQSMREVFRATPILIKTTPILAHFQRRKYQPIDLFLIKNLLNQGGVLFGRVLHSITSSQKGGSMEL